MPTITVSTGTTTVTTTTANNYIVKGTGTLKVVSGGEIDGTIVISTAGTVSVGSGTTAGTTTNLTTISNGGKEVVGSAGSVDTVTVLSGGSETVSNGGYINTLTLNKSGTLNVLSGGEVDYATVLNGASFTVSSGANVYYATLNAGGNLTVSSGSNLYGANILTGATLTVSAGVQTSQTNISGGTEIVLSGGTENSATLNSGALNVSSGGTAYGTTNFGGTETVTGVGASEMGAFLYAGNLNISAGGSTTGSVIEGGTETVFAGGTASGDFIYAGGAETVSAGGVASGTTLYGGSQTVFGTTSQNNLSGGSEVVSSGGVASGTIVNAGGSLIVASSGTTISTTVLNGGSEIVSSGGVASASTVSSGGVEFVASGGTDSGSVVSTGGVEAVVSGATLSNVTISAGGVLAVSGGTVAGTQNLAPFAATTVVNLASNGTVTSLGGEIGETVLAGGTIIVSSGAVASATTVNSGGSIVVLPGGLASQDTILSGGSETVSSGGTAINGVISSGGSETVVSGGILTNETFNAGAALVVSGGTISGTTLQVAAFTTPTIVSWPAGGGNQATTAIGETVGLNGALVAISGGIVSNTTVSSGGAVSVYGGDTISGTVVQNGGREVLGGTFGGTSGTEVGGTVNSGGALTVSSGGTASGGTINSGGTETVSAGGAASGGTVSSGGTVFVAASGVLVNETFNSGANLAVAGGTLSGAAASLTLSGFTAPTVVNWPASGGSQATAVTGETIISGATLTVLAGAFTSGDSVSSGGTLSIGQGGSGSHDTIYGGTEVIGSGGVETSVSLYYGANLLISGGFVSSAYYGGTSSGGITVESGGVISGSNLYYGEKETISNGGSSISDSGYQGSFTVLAGGLISGTTGSYDQIVVSSGGTASATALGANGGVTLSGGIGIGIHVSAGASAVVLTGGVDSGAIVSAGGTETVSSGGSASGATLSGGTESLLSSGAASGTVISSGGILYISSGANASGTIINSGGTEIVLAGGTADGTTVNSGGTETVSSGGFTSGTTVNSGGTELVYNGAALSNATLSAGANVVENGAVISGATTLAGISTTLTGINLVSGGSLPDVVTLISGSVVSGGTLTVSSGGVQSATVLSSGGTDNVMVGGSAYATSVGSGASFTVSGGVTVSNTSVTGSETVLGIDMGGYISGTGVQTILAGGLASGTTNVLLGGTQVISSGGSAVGTVANNGGVVSVTSGGSATSGRIFAGGNEYVLGSVSGITISGGFNSGMIGGALTVSSGGSATGTTVSGGTTLGGLGGKEIVLAGGVASGTTVSGPAGAGWTGGSAVANGGTESNAIVKGGVIIAVGDGVNSGIDSGATISSGASAVVSSGGEDLGVAVLSGGTEIVSSGGFASGTTVNSGGVETFYVGGQASAMTFSAGAKLTEVGMVISGAGNTLTLGSLTSTDAGVNIPTGGITSDVVSTLSATTLAGGAIAVSSGGVATSTTVSSGGSVTVFSSGLANSTVVSNGGSMTVSSGGIDSGTSVLSGGSETVSSGGVDRAIKIGNGGSAVISSGGSAVSSGTVSSGGAILVAFGGLISGLSVASGGSATIAGTASATADAGSMTVLAGGSATGTTGGGVEIVLGTETSAAFTGSQTISSGGVVSAGSVTSQFISAGGLAKGVNAASQFVYSGGSAVGNVTGVQTVYAGGFASSGNVTGTQIILSGASASNFNVTGTEEVYVGGTVTSATISANANLVEVGLTVSNGISVVLQPITATVSNVSIGPAGTTSNLTRLISATVQSGGTITISSGGSTSSTTVLNGGTEIVAGGPVSNGFATGGMATGTIVNSGGTEKVLRNGFEPGVLASATVAGSLTDSGLAYDTTVLSGGTDTITNSGVAFNSILNGGTEIVQSGGSAAWTVSYPGSSIFMSNGGYEDVLSGGYLAYSATIGSGGTLELHAGAVTSGLVAGNGATVAFTATSGTVAFDNTTSTNTPITGFQVGDQIALGAFTAPITSAILSNGGSKLTLSDGAQSYVVSSIAFAPGILSGGQLSEPYQFSFDTTVVNGVSMYAVTLAAEAPEGPVLSGTIGTAGEGGVVTLGLTDATFDSDDTLGTVTITGLPSDLSGFSGSGTYTSGTGTWTGSASDFNALQFTAGEDGTYNLTVSATNTTPGEAATTTSNYTLVVSGVPEAPALTGTIGTASEGGVVTLGLTDTPFDNDDTGVVTITGLPTDLTGFNGSGTYTPGTGTWTGSASDFNALHFTAGEDGTYNLTVSATNTTPGEAATTTSNYTLVVSGAPEAPSLSGSIGTANEGGVVTLGLTDTAFDNDDTGVVTITGLPTDLTGFNGSGSYTAGTGTWTGSASDFNALHFTAGEDGTYNLTVSATNTTPNEAATTTSNYTLVVSGVPEAPLLTGSIGTANEGGVVTLGLTDAAVDSDDTLGTVTITGLPTDLTGFNGSGSYTPGTGTWTGSATDFNALHFTAGEDGTYNLTVSATNTTPNEAATTTSNYTLVVSGVPEAPLLTGSIGTANEGGVVTLGLTDAAVNSDDTLGTVTITGLPADLTNFSGGGSYTAGTGTWTGSATDFNALHFTAGEDGTYNLTVSATNTTPNEAATTTSNYTLIVSGVPEAPLLSGSIGAANEGGVVTLGLTDAAADPDDTLGTVTITGLPADLTNFSGGGTYTAGTGTWTGSATDFNALHFTAGEDGTYNLTVSATNTTPNEAATTTSNYTLIVSGVPEAPLLGGATSATVNYAGLVTLGATDTAVNSDDTETVTITGLPSDLTNFNGGSYTAGTGTWTGSAANFNALTFNAGDTAATLTITATNTTTGEVASTVESYALGVTQPTYVLTTGPDTVVGTPFNDIIMAATNTLSSGDNIDGGGGVNTLELTGAGTFNLGAPATLTNIQVITVSEAHVPYSLVTLRAGLNATLNVINSSPSTGINIIGAANSNVINLGAGTDTVTVGSGETVNGGSGIDTYNVAASTIGAVTINGGSGTNVLTLTSAGTVNLGGVSKFATINLAAGNSSVTVTDTTLSAGSVTIADGSSGNNSVHASTDTSASTGKTLAYFAGSGTDSFTGGFENDTVHVSAAAVAGDTLTGGSGTNTLTLKSAGSVNLGGVSRFGTINLLAGNSSVTVTDKTLSGGTVGIHDGSSGNNSVSAAGDTSASKGKTLTWFTGAGTDSFTGGFENDTVNVTAAAVGGDTLTGGSGINKLALSSAGSVNLGQVSNFGSITLASGNSTVTVTDTTLSGAAVSIYDGSSGNNSVSAAGDTTASKGKTLNYYAGSGKDTFTGGFENDIVHVSAAALAGDTLTGGSGTNVLMLTNSGTANLGGVSNFATIDLFAGNTTVYATAALVSSVVLTGSSNGNTLVLTSAGSLNLGGVSRIGVIDLAAGNNAVTVTDTTLTLSITVNDGASGNNSISAAGDTAASHGKVLTWFAGTGTDSLAGGFENDLVHVSAAAVGGDTLTGGSGVNTLTLSSAGSVALGGVSKFATINLAAGANTVTVTDTTLSGGSVALHAGASGNNTISAAGDTSASTGKALSYFAGPGTDNFTGGFENDTVDVSAAAVGSDTLTGGSGTNTLVLTTNGSVNLAGVSKFGAIDLAAGNSTVTITNTALAIGAVGLHDGASGNETVSAATDTSASTGKTLTYYTGSGTDKFTGGFENDAVHVSAAAVGADTLTGGSGNNALTLSSAGSVNLGGVSKFATVNLLAGNNTVTVTDTTLSGGSVGVHDGASGNNSVSAAGDTSASIGKSLNYFTGAGTDSFTGGFENDTVNVTAAAVGGDTLTGGSGSNKLTLTSAGSVSLGGVSHFGTVALAAGSSTVTVTDTTLSGGSVTINDGASGSNSVSAAGDTSASAGKSLTYVAGSGADSFTGGFENDTIYAGTGLGSYTAGSGNDTFVFIKSSLADQTLNNFQVAADHILVYGLSATNGFNLGTTDNVLNPTIPTAIDPSIFIADSTGDFTSSTERFAYDTSTGQLIYSATGSNLPSAQSVVATLTGEPTINASNLLFEH